MKSVLNGLFRSNSLSVSVSLSLSLSLSVRPTFCKVFEEEFSLVRNAWLDDFITRFQLSFLVLLFFSLRFALRLRREKKAWRGECTRAEFVPVAAAFSFPACASSVLFFFYVFAYMRFPTATTGLRDLFDVDYGEQPVPRNEGGRDFHSAAHRSWENELSSGTFTRTSRWFVSARLPMIRSHPPYLSAGSRFACLMSFACRVNSPNKRLVGLIRR